MSRGLVHLYHGDGKGKTTAAVGLAVRGAGQGMRVIFLQLLKDESSGERAVLRGIRGVEVVPNPKQIPFSFQMTPEQKKEVLADNEQRVRQAFAQAEKCGAGLLVLDEAVGAMGCGLLKEETVLRLLKERPEGLEVVLTGREPSKRVIEAADYVTEMVLRRHPFEKGMGARRGIEW